MIAGISVCEELKAIRCGEAEEIRDALWKELKLLEYKDVWEGRTKHMENFAAPVLMDQFTS
jgi:sarcosine oxidase subunit alpha